MDESQEILDLVDGDDEVIGTVARGAFNHHAEEHGYVRAAEAFIINDAGELWVPRRTAHKTHAPNGLDFSISEHVTSGESYLQAVIRGFAEELNITVSAEELEEVGTIEPTSTMPWFAALYLYRSNVDPDFNTDDFTEGIWISPTDLLERLEGAEPAKSGLAPAIRFWQQNSEPAA